MSSSIEGLEEEIKNQGLKVTELKKNGPSSELEQAIAKLLELKNSLPDGHPLKPIPKSEKKKIEKEASKAATANATSTTSTESAVILGTPEQETELANAKKSVVDLKANKAPKEEIDAAVAKLLELKKSLPAGHLDHPDTKKPKPSAVASAPVTTAAPTEKKDSKKSSDVPPSGGEKEAKSAKVEKIRPPPPSSSSSQNSSIAVTKPENPLMLKFVAKLTGASYDGSATKISIPNRGIISGVNTIARYFVRCCDHSSSSLYPSNDPFLQAEIDELLDLLSFGSPTLEGLNSRLANRTFMVGYQLTLADCACFAFVSENLALLKDDSLPHISRWFKLISAYPEFELLKPLVPESRHCPPLPGAIMGQVVTRFPPEPSGHLHIGHMKAIFLNDYYAKYYNGKLLLRFDDTNPLKEKTEYEHGIIEDLATLEVRPHAVSWTSDHFEVILQYAETLIKEGNAYIDDTEEELMKIQRTAGEANACRSKTVEENLRDWKLMLNAHIPQAITTGNNVPDKKSDKKSDGKDKKTEGKDSKTAAAAAAAASVPVIDATKFCLRAKIDIKHKNGAMRDPVFARVITDVPHARRKREFCVYPTYDLACPIVDSIEGVTHAMRDTNYTDRNMLYEWVLEKLALRQVRLRPFGRLNFNYTIMSKRHLGWFVETGKVQDWSDPRFPTIKGMMRRGLQVSALREFMLNSGASMNDVNHEWDIFWNLNLKVIDPIAARYFAVSRDNSIPFYLENVSNVEGKMIPKHPKDLDGSQFGFKTIFTAPTVLVEQEDCQAIQVGDKVALLRWKVAEITSVKRDANNRVIELSGKLHDNPELFKTTKIYLTWIAKCEHNIDVEMMEYDWLISKKILESGEDFKNFLNQETEAMTPLVGNGCMKSLKVGDVIQIERRGFMRVDRAYSPRATMRVVLIPDGKQKAMSTLSTKFTHR